MPCPIQRPVGLSDDDILTLAENISEYRIKHTDYSVRLTNPDKTRRYLAHYLKNKQREYFVCLFLTAHQRVIACETLFKGGIRFCEISSREVLKAAMVHNAESVIFAHNHPSGDPTPSTADKNITQKLIDVLALVDIRVLDHLVIGSEGTTSFSELGIL
ncbi:MAG: JAB domain-containing protein [Gammaproteobacteria bacterium]